MFSNIIRLLHLSLFVAFVDGSNEPNIPLQQVRSQNTRREIILSTVSIGRSKNVSATISFPDTRAICTIFWTNGYLGNNIMEYDSFYEPHKAEAELTFIDKQREHLKKVRNVLNDHVSDLGISYRCILISTGFDNCIVIHMNMSKELIASAVVYGNDTKITINNIIGEAMNHLLGGSYLDLLRKDTLARFRRWNGIRKGVLHFDGADVFKSDFRTLYGRENNTVCQTWTTNVVQFSLSLEGPNMNITAKEVAEDWSSRYSRVSVNTSGGEDVSQLVCVLRAATGWFVRYSHPAYKEPTFSTVRRRLTTTSVRTVNVVTTVLMNISTSILIPTTTESSTSIVQTNTIMATHNMIKSHTTTENDQLETEVILNQTEDYSGITDSSVGHESVSDRLWAVTVTVSLVTLMGLLCIIGVMIICYKRTRMNVLDIERIEKRWQAIFIVNRYKTSNT
ncbi:pr145 [rat cytomegalovirus strain Maastricht]|uniref:Pr145 n=1 Tax=Rat cytomegalovirus (strain Maastricht) TaxID=79700 RepID=Q9DW51_RCMVM|nr:pr145 [rat cytomegalovirus strain Maastricht]AAF99239.1 pr145 [rat cytomegalovirus strain Maastricht]WEG72059.1 membrane protein r145 [Murid betaherpesvirus 2]